MLNTLSLNDNLLTHCNECMKKALAARHPVWQKLCSQMNDIDFIRLSLLRSVSAVDSGRHCIQIAEEVHSKLLPHLTYFKALKFSRRIRMLEATDPQSYLIRSKINLKEEKPGLLRLSHSIIKCVSTMTYHYNARLRKSFKKTSPQVDSFIG